jgi:hypothetical protein
VRTLADGLGTVGQPMGSHARARSRRQTNLRLANLHYDDAKRRRTPEG